jgi:hypothetical protein
VDSDYTVGVYLTSFFCDIQARQIKKPDTLWTFLDSPDGATKIEFDTECGMGVD